MKLEIKDTYKIGDSQVSRNHIICIPPTNGNRTDIIGESNNYYYNCTKKQFIKEYGIKDSIAIIIEIKNGKVELK